MTTASQENSVRYRVTGMDCPSCAAKIESAVRPLPGVQNVKVSTASQILTLQVEPGQAQLSVVEETVAQLGYQLHVLRGGDQESGDSSAHLNPGYKKALWLVVILNVGYGLAEMVGGFLANSQALKADALDFLGDGFITWLGLLAMGWSLLWRARSALLQGIFLGALGLGVFASTLYRLVTLQQPEPELMGILGLIALAVNVGAAMVLVPHRHGDSNVKAVWLFSRNDAIGNLAVVVAAGLVAWLQSPWPDLVVALLISGLFLHSSWTIIRDAQSDLAAPPTTAPTS